MFFFLSSPLSGTSQDPHHRRRIFFFDGTFHRANKNRAENGGFAGCCTCLENVLRIALMAASLDVLFSFDRYNSTDWLVSESSKGSLQCFFAGITASVIHVLKLAAFVVREPTVDLFRPAFGQNEFLLQSPSRIFNV